MQKTEKKGRRGPDKQYDSKVLLPISEALLSRAKAVAADGESRLDVIRIGAEKEIRRRERASPNPAKQI